MAELTEEKKNKAVKADGGPDGTEPAETGGESAAEPEAEDEKGAEMFRAAVDKTLKDRGEQLCHKLMELALKGSVVSAKLLLSFAGQKPLKKSEKKARRSMAEMWAAEQPWQDEPLTEETAESGAGNREPEI